MSLTIEDQLQIERLIARYNFAIDSANGKEIASYFTADGRFKVDHEVLAEGQAGLEQFASELSSQGPMRHVVTSILIEGEGNSATSKAYCQVFTTTPEKGHHVFMQGVYSDQLTKQDKGWVFVERHFTADPHEPSNK